MKKSRELIFLEPQLKEMIWGGRRLVTQFPYQDHISSDGENAFYGESWNISAHPNGDCLIKNGIYKGHTLSELYRDHRELFGNIEFPEFPLLIKIIDAREDLSIQVHPDDEYAREKEHCPYGKMECWYILDCPQEASLVIGHTASSREELTELIRQDRYGELIREIPVQKGDMIQINPGTIHALKGGFLILETQQNSDITYRVYDYGRMQDGKPRPLHVDKSLEVINVPDQVTEKDIRSGNHGMENELVLLNECRYYRVWHGRITAKCNISIEEKPFLNLVVLDGEGTIDGIPIRKGDSCIVPSGYGDGEIVGDLEIIVSSI